ncbi:MAG: trypsin-like peptidase domain-containing protein [Roseovarius sp.]|nr:trypsin-like peptidase domain-containing protein [Roseovarius sp.]
MCRFLLALAFVFIMPLQLMAETRLPSNQAEISLSFAPLVKQAAPAVVNIYAKRIVNVRASPFAGDPFFDNLFRDFGGPRQRVQNSLGSGVILSANGIVVSNYHVVGEATDIRVVLNDRREFKGRVLLSDQESDLAILQLDDAENMPALALRDSDTVEVGELVLAIGNPFGVGQTVSSGIVSGLARSGTAMGNARGYFIQTDAPINPGNSGGALIDVTGRLIGINTSILSRSGGSNGIGFAIPSALVAQFVAQAQAGNTRFERPWAGVTGQPVDADLTDVLGLDRPGGVILSDFHAASPLKAAGLISGDVVTAVDGASVNTPAEMIYRMTVAGLGAEAQLTRVRDGQSEDVTITLIAPPDVPPRASYVTTTVLPGITLEQINPAVAAELGLPNMATGVVVSDPGATGARAGLRQGDILLGINRIPLSTPAEADTLLQQAKGRLALTVQRGQRRVTLRFRI